MGERHLYFLGCQFLQYITTGGLAQFNLPPSEAKIGYPSFKVCAVCTWDLLERESEGGELVVETEEVVKASLHCCLLFPSDSPSTELT